MEATAHAAAFFLLKASLSFMCLPFVKPFKTASAISLTYEPAPFTNWRRLQQERERERVSEERERERDREKER